MIDELHGMAGEQVFSHDTRKICKYVLFDRQNGESAAPFATLNTSFSVGDRKKYVEGNRKYVKKCLSVPRLASARQIHGDRIYSIASPMVEDLEVDGYDALITNQRNVGLLIQHADCQAVLLFDAKQQVIAAVHCGWRGSVLEVLAKTVDRMCSEYNSNPVDLLAVISPSLGPCCSEFVNHEKELPTSFRDFMVGENYFDFWRISLHQLIQCGLSPAAVTLPTVCTSCSANYFSYRRACRNGDGITGRNGSVIAMYE